MELVLVLPALTAACGTHRAARTHAAYRSMQRWAGHARGLRCSGDTKGTVLLVEAVTEDHWAPEGTYPGMRLFFEGGTAAGTSCACVTPWLPQIVCAGSA